MAVIMSIKKPASLFVLVILISVWLIITKAEFPHTIHDSLAKLLNATHAHQDSNEPSYLFGMSSVDRSGHGALYLHLTLSIIFDPALTMRHKVVVFLADQEPEK